VRDADGNHSVVARSQEHRPVARLEDHLAVQNEHALLERVHMVIEESAGIELRDRESRMDGAGGPVHDSPTSESPYVPLVAGRDAELRLAGGPENMARAHDSADSAFFLAKASTK
jgi:hypothetical protein